MPHGNELKFKREFTKDQLKGRHHLTLTPPELNESFLAECVEARRVPSDMIRIILEDRYSTVRYPKSVEGKPHVDEKNTRDVPHYTGTAKRDVA